MERLRLAFADLLRGAYTKLLPLPPILIPDELIREILLLLPVKSLVRFKCVCKSWNLIISEPQFVKLHLRRSIANAADMASTRLLYDTFNSLTSDNYFLADSRSWTRSESLLFFSSQNEKRHDLYPIENGYNLIGVCNGLVSLVKWEYHFSEETLISCTARVRLWNPATRLWSQLSPPLYLIPAIFPSLSDNIVWNFGFGYDCLNDTYKVVVVHHDRSRVNVVKVYEMGSSCWRSIQSFPAMLLLCSRKGVYVRGTLNWIVKVVNTNLFIILSLDLGTEEYSQWSLPDFAQHSTQLAVEAKDTFFPILGVLKDCLCVLQNDGNKRFLIWLMKEVRGHKSWTQLFNIDFEEEFIFLRDSFLNHLYGFVLSENDEVLLISNNTLGDLVLYNKRENTFKFTKKCTRRRLYSIVNWNVASYVESLVSPERN